MTKFDFTEGIGNEMVASLLETANCQTDLTISGRSLLMPGVGTENELVGQSIFCLVKRLRENNFMLLMG